MSVDTPRPSQERALRHVQALSSGKPLDAHLRVTLNFHPDRLIGGLPILAKLADDGVYVAQFVTGTSNGPSDSRNTSATAWTVNAFPVGSCTTVDTTSPFPPCRR
ncbi:DUF3626 domain-containing protein [Streptomyces hirsutus]|uniref:DUF3626 domain-containing protein n=1 Tax=Streptomyces hirsutus TaxID=35620 RepID=UPI0036270B74